MASRHRFLIDGRERTVVVHEADGRTTVTIDGGEPIEVDATISGLPGYLSMLIDGTPSNAYVSRRGQGFQVTVDGRGFRVEPAAGGGRGRSPIGGLEDALGQVTAPLAGVVVELRVKVGDHIESGQALLVIEAMKMQNEVLAAHAGTVTQILIAEGARAGKGDVILEYDPEE